MTKQSSKDGLVSKISVGDRFGTWVVLSEPFRKVVGHKKPQEMWHVRCRCSISGAEKDHTIYNLLGGQTNQPQLLAYKTRKQSEPRKYLHILASRKLTSRWIGIYRGMLSRCYDPAHLSYVNYGGRGIRICDKWLNNPEEFLHWVAGQPEHSTPDSEIDRVDNDGNYEPDNCRITDRTTNSRNTRAIVWVEYLGERMCATEFRNRYTPRWSASNTIQYFNRGWTAEALLERYRQIFS